MKDKEMLKDMIESGNKVIFTTRREPGRDERSRIRCFLAYDKGYMVEITAMVGNATNMRLTKNRSEIIVPGYGTDPSTTAVQNISFELYGNVNELKLCRL